MKKRTLLSVFFTFLFFIATQIIFSSIGFMLQGAEISSTFLIFPVIGDVIFALSAFLYSKKKKLLPKFNNRSKIPIKNCFVSFIAIISYSILGNFILYSLPNNMPESMELMEHSMQANPILYCIAVYLIAPVTEEFVFRGFIQTRLRATMNVIPAILISSLLFGITHLMTGSILTALFALFGGIIFGLTFEKTGSLILTISVHIVGNLCELIVMLPIMF